MTTPLTMKDIATADDPICGLPGAPAGGRCLRPANHNDGVCATVGAEEVDGQMMYEPVTWQTVGWDAPPAIGTAPVPTPLPESIALLASGVDEGSAIVESVGDLILFLNIHPDGQLGLMLSGMAGLPEADRKRIRGEYPRAVRAWELVTYCVSNAQPAPTVDELNSWLMREGL